MLMFNFCKRFVRALRAIVTKGETEFGGAFDQYKLFRDYLFNALSEQVSTLSIKTQVKWYYATSMAYDLDEESYEAIETIADNSQFSYLKNIITPASKVINTTTTVGTYIVPDMLEDDNSTDAKKHRNRKKKKEESTSKRHLSVVEKVQNVIAHIIHKLRDNDREAIADEIANGITREDSPLESSYRMVYAKWLGKLRQLNKDNHDIDQLIEELHYPDRRDYFWKK